VYRFPWEYFVPEKASYDWQVAAVLEIRNKNGLRGGGVGKFCGGSGIVRRVTK
jgi:hypothetical protein